MQTYEQGQVCYLTGEHGEAVKHVYLGSQWVPMSAEMESVIKILNDRYSARDVEWQARVDKLRTVLTGLLLAKDVLFRCVCEADDEEHLQSLVDSTDNLWNDARAALGREA